MSGHVDFAALASGGIAQLQAYQPGKPIEELQRELGLGDIIKLASNENPLGPCCEVLQVIQQSLPNIARYPDAFELTTALASRLGVDGKQIILGNGSNQVLNLVAQTFLTPALNAIVSAHAFIVYPLAVRAIGAQLKTIPARNYGHDLIAMAEAIDNKTRVVFIANPNNPTGTWNAADDIQAFLERIPPHVIVVVDEAYAEYVVAPDYQSALPHINDHPNLVVTRTFSKAYGLAGLRIGYGIASAPVADLLNRFREPFNVNSLALAAAKTALANDEHIQKSVSLNLAGMEQLTSGLRKRGLTYIPSVGNFIAVEFKQDAAVLYQKLLAEGVIVRPVGIYDMPNHLRVSIGLAEENQRFLQALDKVLSL